MGHTTLGTGPPRRAAHLRAGQKAFAQILDSTAIKPSSYDALLRRFVTDSDAPATGGSRNAWQWHRPQAARLAGAVGAPAPTQLAHPLRQPLPRGAGELELHGQLGPDLCQLRHDILGGVLPPHKLKDADFVPGQLEQQRAHGVCAHLGHSLTEDAVPQHRSQRLPRQPRPAVGGKGRGGGAGVQMTGRRDGGAAGIGSRRSPCCPAIRARREGTVHLPPNLLVTARRGQQHPRPARQPKIERVVGGGVACVQRNQHIQLGGGRALPPGASGCVPGCVPGHVPGHVPPGASGCISRCIPGHVPGRVPGHAPGCTRSFSPWVRCPLCRGEQVLNVTLLKAEPVKFAPQPLCDAPHLVHQIRPQLHPHRLDGPTARRQVGVGGEGEVATPAPNVAHAQPGGGRSVARCGQWGCRRQGQTGSCSGSDSTLYGCMKAGPRLWGLADHPRQGVHEPVDLAELGRHPWPRLAIGGAHTQCNQKWSRRGKLPRLGAIVRGRGSLPCGQYRARVQGDVGGRADKRRLVREQARRAAL
eukprot:scaffold11360_cov114-Isochrysis_galbana.AAC.3